TLDGGVLAEGDEVLLPFQTDASENGIWLIQASGTAPTRRPDFDDGSEVLGAVVFVREGTLNAATFWGVDNSTEPVVDTDDITFTQLSPGLSTADLDAAVFGYLDHGNTGSTETF